MIRVVALADSDSYLKWSAATLAAMPPTWQSEQWLINSPIAPSEAQVEAATQRRVDRITAVQAIRRLLDDPPDVVLLASTGPVVQTMLRFGLPRWGADRPVLVTGLPGISIPATERALEFRSGCDLFLLHSHREITEFSAAAQRLGISIRFGLATLPFIQQARTALDQDAADHDAVDHGEVDHGGEGLPKKIIFAAQAKVPAEQSEREQVLRAFAALPPKQRVVIKLRALPGEQQTHRELLPYPELWEELVRQEGYAPDLIDFAGGSMADALRHADGFVTVSSTAALEAIGVSVPILVLTDFGVSAEAINEVFVGSGCLGSLDDLANGKLCRPADSWLRDNYFHPSEDADWVERIDEQLRSRRQRGLQRAEIRVVDGRWRQAQRHVRLVAPRQVLRLTGKLLRRVKRVRRAARRLISGPPSTDPDQASAQESRAA